MRITHDTLMRIATDAVARKTRADRMLLGAYLCGSLLTEDVLLGGTADIDLVFVHSEPVGIPREIARLTDEVHLDIAHHYHRSYREPRSLRVHPWLGPTLNNCRVLYDPQHFLDFTQASVRGQFDRADFIFERAQSFAEQARQIWFSLQGGSGEADPANIHNYLRSIEYSTNSIAVLTGLPLSERRFLLHFQQRAVALGHSGLYPGLLGLLGAANLPVNAFHTWLPQFQKTLELVPEPYAQGNLHPDRRHYYCDAIQALSQTPQLVTALWPLLYRWTTAAVRLPAHSPELDDWQAAVNTLGLTGAQFAERLQALDAYLDLVDEALEAWARANGAWER